MSDDTSLPAQLLEAENDGAYEHWAFISYHSINTNIARRLKEEIEGFRVPKTIQKQSRGPFKVGSHLRPIFCDRATFPLGAELDEGLKGALDASRFLILLYSPEAAQSKWVKTEIEYFLALGREDRILGILVSGQMDDLRQFLQERHTAVARKTELPPNVERTFADLQSKHDDWRTIILRTLAGMTGVSLDAYLKREQLSGAGAKKFYSSFVTQWHLPKGVNELERTVARRQPTCYCFKWGRGKLRRVEHLKGGAKLLEGGFAHNAAALELHYNERGTLIGMAFFDKAGNQVGATNLSPDSRYGTQIKSATGGPAWSGRAKSSSTDFFGITPADWQSFMLQHGKTQAHRTQYALSKEGFVVEERMLDLADRPYVNDMLIHGYAYVRDESGMCKSMSYIGLDGRPCSDRFGVWRVDYEHAAFGEMTMEVFRDENGKPTMGEYGYAIQRIEHEYEGRTFRAVRCSYFDADDKPTVVHRGFSVFQSLTDDRGNYVEHRYFNPLGQPVCCIEGHAVSRGAYDQHGNQTRALFYGVDGCLIKNSWGRVGWQAAYDPAGNQTEFVDLAPGRSGSLVPLYPKTLMSYDKAARLIERRFVNARGKPVENSSGYAAEMLEYHERDGHLIRREFRDRQMRPVVRRNLGDEIEDCAAVAYRYTGYGDLEALQLLGTDGTLRVSKWGFAEIRLNFDRRGLVEGMSFHGAHGESVACMLGFHRFREQFEPRTLVRTVEYFGCDGQPVDVMKPAASGTLQSGHMAFFPPTFHKVIISGARVEKKVRYDFFAADGIQTGPGWEYAAVEIIQRSRETMECLFFNEEGNLREAPSRSFVHFDEAERPTSIRYLNAAGEMVEDGWGTCLRTAEHLPDGSVRWRWFNSQEQELACLPYVPALAEEPSSPSQLHLHDGILRAGSWSVLSSSKWAEPEALMAELRDAAASSPFRRKISLLAIREGDPHILAETRAKVEKAAWAVYPVPVEELKKIDEAAIRLPGGEAFSKPR